MDRKFIKENCDRCFCMLNPFGVKHCAYHMDAKFRGLVPCTMVEKCPPLEEFGNLKYYVREKKTKKLEDE